MYMFFTSAGLERLIILTKDFARSPSFAKNQDQNLIPISVTNETKEIK